MSIRSILQLFFIFLFFSPIFSSYNYAPDFEHVDYERPIVVCVPSYNNEKYCIKCLESIFSQNYSNYRVIYIDDASTDETYKKVLDFIVTNNYQDKVVLIRNSQNEGMVFNHYFMANLCMPCEIVVSLDGDDSFYCDDALSRINRAYMDPNVWVTYGQFEETGSIYCHKPTAVFKHKLHPHIIRRTPFMFMQPRTYYAGLFHLIPSSHLKLGDKFFPIAGDVAIMTFLIDMARDHTFFIPDIIYSYNNENPINDFKKNRNYQLIVENYIKTFPPLERIEELYW